MKKLKLCLPLLATVFLFTGCAQEDSDKAFEYYGFTLEDGEDTVWTVGNDAVSLSIDVTTTQFTFTDKYGKTWYSSPTDAATSGGSDANNAMSNLIIEYSTEQGVTNTYNSYAYSVQKEIYEVEKVEDGDELGFNIYYTIGNVNKEYLFPQALPESEMTAYTDQMDASSVKKYIRQYYRLYDINSLRSTDNQDELLAQYPELAEENVYVFIQDTPDYIKENIQALFESVGYTKEDYLENVERYGGSAASSTAVFNVTLQLRIEDDELVATVPFDEISYTSSYIPIHIDVLPYFGAADTDSEGYMLVPDGCGAIINFNNGKTAQSPYNSRVYGWDDAVLRTELVDDSISTFAAFGIAYYESERVVNAAVTEDAADANEDTADAVEDATDGTEDTTDAIEDAADATEDVADAVEDVADANEDTADATEDAAADDGTEQAAETETEIETETVPAASMLCVLEEGKTYATIEADISGRLGNYNYAFASYDLIHYIDLDVSEKSDTTVRNFEKQLGAGQVISQRYIFSDSDSYVDMAAVYREYLMEAMGLEKLEDTSVPVVIEAIGAVDTVDQVAGIPTTVSLPLTSYSEAADIITDLNGQGLDGFLFKYSGWFNGGVQNTNARSVSLISKLGTKKQFKSMLETAQENGTEVYLAATFTYIYRDKWYDSYSVKRDSAKYIGREIVELLPISSIWFGQDESDTSYYLAKPSYALTSLNKFVSAIEGYGAENIAFNDYGYTLSSDYNPKKTVTREESMELQTEALAGLVDSGNGIMIQGGNDYALQYADIVTDMWIDSKLYNIENESVPFYQIALHGLVDYTGTALNLADDYETTLLRSLETGAGVYFTVMEEEVSALGDSEYTNYYGANYDMWRDTIVSLVDTLNSDLGHVYNQFIVDHRSIAAGVTLTEYEDGTQVIVNYNYTDYTYEGNTVAARDYIVIGGDK